MTVFDLFHFFKVNTLAEPQTFSHLHQISIGFDPFILSDSAQTVQICIHKLEIKIEPPGLNSRI